MMATQGYGTGSSIAVFGYSASELLRAFRELIDGFSILRSPGKIDGWSEIQKEISALSYHSHSTEGHSVISQSVCRDSLLGLEGPDEL